MTTLPFLLLVLTPFVIFDSDYTLILCPLCKSNTLLNTFMMLGSTVGQDNMSGTKRMTTLVSLLLELSPCVFFFKLILYLLCNSTTLWNILMVFGRNV